MINTVQSKSISHVKSNKILDIVITHFPHLKYLLGTILRKSKMSSVKLLYFKHCVNNVNSIFIFYI